ncbi:MAG: NAD(P)-binding domain-containing protein [Prosthecobacter sp.]|nr:NAD(P)-binding domain-containing protein [Prosthecobacter sp.]
MKDEVLIVGAGPAGLGCAVALHACGVRARVLDGAGVGAAFAAWPRQMRLLTPSFHSGNFGCVDLNAVTPDTSPADFLHTQHPDGREYARYLHALAAHYEIEVETPVRVTRVVPLNSGGFSLETSAGMRDARFVIWAAGEFATPDFGGIQGAGLCRHASRVADWDEVAAEGKSFAVVGGYESGIDAAIHLMERGKEVVVLSRGEPWAMDDPDPSRSLSPRTRDRLRAALLEAPGRVRFFKNANITRVERHEEGYRLFNDEGTAFACPTAPLLCTGFHSALEAAPVRGLWEMRDGQPLLSEAADESTLHPGLFYSGPSLRHRGMLFCFIYKFRARFGIVARAIAQRMGLEWEVPLAKWRELGFMLEDLSCCAECQCAVEAEPEVQPEVLPYAAVVAV